MAELFVDSAAPAKRPPVIKVDLHRPPHGDPSGDGKAFPRNDGPSAALVAQQSLAEYQAYGKEYQSDEQAAPALIQQSLELQIVDLGTVRKIVVYPCFDQFLGVFGGALLEVDMQSHGIIQGEFERPAHNEFLRVRVEIFFNKGRR